MKSLQFGTMPKGATPQTHLAAGAWCFSGQEDAFPHWWEEQGFPLPEDPFNDAFTLQTTAQRANGEALRLIDVLGKELAKHHNTPYSYEFWEIALGPWLLLCTHMFAERQARVQQLATLYSTTEIMVPLIGKDVSFSFANSLDFMLNGVLDVQFNHYLYSRIVEAIAPKSWQLTYTDTITSPHQTQPQVAPGSTSWKQHAKKFVGSHLLTMPFPLQKGFSLSQCGLLSVAVLRNNNKHDNTIPFAEYCKQPIQWLFPAEAIIRSIVPTELYENAIPAIPKSKGKLRGMTAAFSQSEAYRMFLGAWRQGGGRLFSIQHGANYGNLHTVGILPFEYKQHAFFTWGWQQNHATKANAIAMPHPTLANVYNTHKQSKEQLIVVGTEMSPFSYRLKSRPAANKQVAYRKNKITFLHTLAPQVVNSTLYRAYPTARSGLEDATFIQKNVPGIALCKGDLTAQMLACKLLVLDHYGTTLHTALAANTPTICFWHKDDWGMDDATMHIIQLLHDAEILFYCPQKAAHKVNEIWGDVTSWWAQPTVQNARAAWLQAYALCNIPTTTKLLGQQGATISSLPQKAIATKKLITYWFNALRNC